jgi:hypothetical protein
MATGHQQHVNVNGDHYQSSSITVHTDVPLSPKRIDHHTVRASGASPSSINHNNTSSSSSSSPYSHLWKKNDTDDAVYTREAFEVQRLAIPVVATYCLECLPPLISLIFVGHLNDQV